ncbi:MAG: hypothetical protein V4568_14545 [Pseudomonadota bacterium]
MTKLELSLARTKELLEKADRIKKPQSTSLDHVTALCDWKKAQDILQAHAAVEIGKYAAALEILLKRMKEACCCEGHTVRCYDCVAISSVEALFEGGT